MWNAIEHFDKNFNSYVKNTGSGLHAAAIQISNYLRNSLLPSGYFETKPRTMLEMSSGTGHSAIPFLQLGYKTFVGIDAVEKMHDAFRARLEYHKISNVNIHMQTGDLHTTRIGIEDQGADLICSFGTFYYLNELDNVMSEIKRILKPDGLCILEIPMHSLPKNEVITQSTQAGVCWSFYPATYIDNLVLKSNLSVVGVAPTNYQGVYVFILKK